MLVRQHDARAVPVVLFAVVIKVIFDLNLDNLLLDNKKLIKVEVKRYLDLLFNNSISCSLVKSPSPSAVVGAEVYLYESIQKYFVRFFQWQKAV